MKNKHTLIIGGTRGTGRALVKAFRAANHTVSVIGRRPPPESDRGVKGVRYWAVDLVNQKRLSKMLREIVSEGGQLSSLVFCQRYRGQDDSWMGDFQTSLSATKQVIETLADAFDDAGDRAIVVLGSIASRFIAGEQPASYHVMKAGLTQMVRYYAVALGRKGIRVNCVSPSSISKEESRHFYLQNPELLELYRRITPLGRMGTAEEIANVVEFLCSAKASFITGQDLVVDGGLSLQGHESMARGLVSLNHLPVTQITPTKRK